MSTPSLNTHSLIARAFHMHGQETAGTSGFLVRAVLHASLPREDSKRKITGDLRKQKHGDLRINLYSPKTVGLPCGWMPRIFLIWMEAEALRTQSRELRLGESLSSFLAELRFIPSGSRWDDTARMRNHMMCLASAFISAVWEDDRCRETWNVSPVERVRMREDTNKDASVPALVLSSAFFDEISAGPVPIRMGILKTFRTSPAILDLHTWMEYEKIGGRRSQRVPWDALHIRFGEDFRWNLTGRKRFQKHMMAMLQTVAKRCHEPELYIDTEEALILDPEKAAALVKRRLARKRKEKELDRHPWLF